MLHRLNRVDAPRSAPIIADTSDAENVPAVVHDMTVGRFKRAAVTHPAGERHDNHRLTIARLMARGYTIVPYRAP